ncbi:GumC family protein [Psychrosphaera aestuarii]|uniref:GumC family protein n=1 Tax=Psychrosphaera aestuarii TaxID=1266052 RepID=UPI001B344555|nr:polysaccharide biosynthesis tyrosine autokinase [Psychrosphaera aestuarii]
MDEKNKQIHQLDDVIDLGELFSIVWSRKWFVVLCVLLSFVLTYNYLLKVPDRFTSSTLIMFKETSSKADAIQNIMTSGLTVADNTETELELLRSRRFAGQIVDNLNLIHNVHYQMQSGYEPFVHSEQLLVKNRSYAIDILSDNIDVLPKAGTNLVEVSYESHSPSHSAIVANEIAKTFINFKEEIMEGKNKDNAYWLESKLSGVKENLLEAERKIAEHQNEHGFIDINSAIAVEKSKLEKLTKEKYDTTREVERLQILKQQILQHKYSPEELFSIPAVANSKTLSQSKLKLQNTQEAFGQVKLRYGPKHPAYIKAKLLFEDARSEVSLELDSHIKTINKTLQLELSNVTSVEAALTKATSRLRDLGMIEFEYEKLRREFDANLELYENLMRRLKESEMMRDLANASNLLVVEKAEVSSSPNNKKSLLIYTLAALASALLAAMIVLIEAMLASKVLQFRKVARSYNTKIIGVVPKIKVRGVRKKPLVQLDPSKHMNFMEALRSTRTNILLDGKLSRQKVIAVTSITPNDGKSSLSIQLANSFSELEKTILVDADLRFPSIGDALGINVNSPGLTNLIAKKQKLSESIHRDTEYKYHVLTAGFQSKNPLLFLSQPRLKKIVDALKSNYERVVLECPPVMSVSDAFVISKHVDSIYLIVDVEKTSQNELSNCLEELAQANIIVGGIILNKVKKTEKYYTGVYSKYLKADLSKARTA